MSPLTASGTTTIDESWEVESWAQCDPAGLPASAAEALGIGVWEDVSGARVPVTKIRSFQGAEHCGWQDIAFLLLGPDDDADQYVRDTSDELAESLRTTCDASAALPPGATDMGLRRDGGSCGWLRGMTRRIW